MAGRLSFPTGISIAFLTQAGLGGFLLPCFPRKRAFKASAAIEEMIRPWRPPVLSRPLAIPMWQPRYRAHVVGRNSIVEASWRQVPEEDAAGCFLKGPVYIQLLGGLRHSDREGVSVCSVRGVDPKHDRNDGSADSCRALCLRPIGLVSVTVQRNRACLGSRHGLRQGYANKATAIGSCTRPILVTRVGKINCLLPPQDGPQALFRRCLPRWGCLCVFDRYRE